MTLQLFLWPTTPGKRQGVVSRWSEADQSGWALMVEDGRIVFVCSDGTKATRVVGPAPLFPETWYSVWVRVDAVSGTVTLAQEVTLNSVNSRFGRIVDIASDGVVSSLLMAAPAAPNVPFIIGGLAEAAGADRTRVTALYNGKVDAPKLYARALDDSDLQRAGNRLGQLPRRKQFERREAGHGALTFVDNGGDRRADRSSPAARMKG